MKGNSMMAKKQHIKVFTNADKDTLAALYRVGGLTKDHIENLGTSENRLKKHIKQGYIERAEEHYDRKTKTSKSIYRLTESGKRKCREICEVGSSYKSAAVKHDLALADKYVELHKQGLTQRWFTEQDWRNKLEEEIERLRNQGNNQEADRIEEQWRKKGISVTDGGYINASGEMVAVEVITKHYTSEQIEAKHEFVQVMNVQYEEINIK